jgi:hypothetical protein
MDGMGGEQWPRTLAGLGGRVAAGRALMLLNVQRATT